MRRVIPLVDATPVKSDNTGEIINRSPIITSYGVTESGSQRPVIELLQGYIARDGSGTSFNQCGGNFASMGHGKKQRL